MTTSLVAFQSDGTQSDSASYGVYLVAGTWKLSTYFKMTPSSGIVTPSVDTTDLATYDTYWASTTYALQNVTGIDVASSGLHTHKYRSDTKNASSTGYGIGLWVATFTRTA